MGGHIPAPTAATSDVKTKLVEGEMSGLINKKRDELVKVRVRVMMNR